MGLRSTPFALLSLALAACHDSSSSGGGPLTNLGLAAVALHGQGELWVAEVAEAGQGVRDLNGDGDTGDSVAFVYDLADGSLTALGLALGGFPVVAVGEVLIGFGVSESDQGADLDADGDTDDLVLHVHDVGAGTTSNTGLAMAPIQPAIGVGLVAFGVLESAQGGQDLDGDGTSGGIVLHLFDSRTGLTTNAQRNLTSDIVFHDHAFGFTTDEVSAGADLNGDGDQTDMRVFEMFDLPLGGLEQVPLAVRGRPLAVNADDWFLLADEADSGLDLNGDGDTNEAVLHEVHPHQHTQQSLGISSLGSFGSNADGGDLALIEQEVDGLDHNGDGDFVDALVVLRSTALGQIFAPGLAIDPTTALVFVADQLAFTVDELAQDEDLNGDGDLADDVLHVMSRGDGLALNRGLDAVALQGAGNLLVLTRPEGVGRDWNFDGDGADEVVFVWDLSQGFPTNTFLASTGSAAVVTPERVLIVVPEHSQREDLNGDGDDLDLVYVVHDVATRASSSLSAAVSTPGAGLTDDGRGVLLVSEEGQGLDLNSDGDELDSVLHRVDLP